MHGSWHAEIRTEYVANPIFMMKDKLVGGRRVLNHPDDDVGV